MRACGLVQTATFGAHCSLQMVFSILKQYFVRCGTDESVSRHKKTVLFLGQNVWPDKNQRFTTTPCRTTTHLLLISARHLACTLVTVPMPMELHHSLFRLAQDRLGRWVSQAMGPPSKRSIAVLSMDAASLSHPLTSHHSDCAAIRSVPLATQQQRRLLRTRTMANPPTPTNSNSRHKPSGFSKPQRNNGKGCAKKRKMLHLVCTLSTVSHPMRCNALTQASSECTVLSTSASASPTTTRTSRAQRRSTTCT